MRFFLLFILCSTWDLAAAAQSNKYLSPKGYKLNQPAVTELPKNLDEISGLSYCETRKAIYAIDDDNGYLYQIRLTPKLNITREPFHKARDFEGIAIYMNKGFALNSNGNIKVFDLQSSGPFGVKDYKFPFGGKNEFESLFIDRNLRKLVLMCKDCSKDNKKELSLFLFDPISHKYEQAGFKLDVNDIAKKLKIESIKFKPSAAAIHPTTGDIYIISSINKLLVLADTKGAIRQVYRIDPTLFKQPEGLTFTPEGDMLISNEAAGKGKANILYYKFEG